VLVRAHKPAFRNNPMEASMFSETHPMEETKRTVGGATNCGDHVRYTLHAKKWRICRENVVKMAHSKWNFPNDFGKRGD